MTKGVGALIASSEMGLSVFDLLDETFDENDVKDFLRDHAIPYESYGQRALVARLIVYFMSCLGNR